MSCKESRLLITQYKMHGCCHVVIVGSYRSANDDLSPLL